METVIFLQELLTIFDRTKLSVGHRYAVVLRMYVCLGNYLSLIVS